MSSLARFGLALNVQYITATSRCYRPPSWPPPRDWVCVEDKFGNAVSSYGHPIWRLDPWAGKPMTMNFGDGVQVSQTTTIDQGNADILRLLVTWRGWGPRGASSTQLRRNSFDCLNHLSFNVKRSITIST